MNCGKKQDMLIDEYYLINNCDVYIYNINCISHTANMFKYKPLSMFVYYLNYPVLPTIKLFINE